MSCWSEASLTSGLTITIFCGGSSLPAQSITATRWAMPTWVAARPTPAASYMVSNRSSTSFLKAASKTVIGLAGMRRRGSGSWRMVSRAMAAASGDAMCEKACSSRRKRLTAKALVPQSPQLPREPPR